MPREPKVVKSLEDLAIRLGVGRSTVYRWQKEMGLPKVEGGWDVAAVRKWWDDYRSQSGRRGGRHGRPRESRGSVWTERYRKAKAQKEQIHVAALQEKLMPVDDVCERGAGQIQCVRSALLAMARTLPEQLEGQSKEEIYTRMDAYVHDMLTNFSKGLPAVPVGRVEELRDMLSGWAEGDREKGPVVEDDLEL